MDGKTIARDRVSDRFGPTLPARYADMSEQKLNSTGALLESLSFRRVLDRGYAVVRDPDGEAVMTAATLQTGDSVSVEFSDGRVGADITATGRPPESPKKPAPRKPRAKARPASKAKADRRQGSLL